MVSFFLSCEKVYEPVNDIDFGNPYRITNPDSIKIGNGDSLYVPVSFDCCFDEHKFEFRYSSIGNTSRVWFKKLSPEAPCTGLCFQWLNTKLPGTVLYSETIILLGPNDFEMIFN